LQRDCRGGPMHAGRQQHLRLHGALGAARMVALSFVRSRGRAAGAAPRLGQRGFALAELALAVALTTMILVWAASRIVHEVDDAAARATGVWLLELKRGM